MTVHEFAVLVLCAAGLAFTFTALYAWHRPDPTVPAQAAIRPAVREKEETRRG